MYPTAAVSVLYLSHPESHDFGAGDVLIQFQIYLGIGAQHRLAVGGASWDRRAEPELKRDERSWAETPHGWPPGTVHAFMHGGVVSPVLNVGKGMTLLGFLGVEDKPWR
jgi:hypothetical protein